MHNKRAIASLRHKVVLCRQDDVVVGNDIVLKRDAVDSMWAAIEARAASAFSPFGAAMNDDRKKRTHIITTRYRSDLNISVMAWIYEQRLQSSPRWFKILKVTETEHKGSAYFKFDCRLVERGDDLSTPEPEDNTATPWKPQQGVRL